MKIAFKKAIRHYKYVTQRFICQLISFQLVTSNIKIVWNCLVAWSMWKKGVKILSGNDDCLDLSASYFVFPHIWENQSFFTTSYREEVKQRGPLCYSTTSVQWQSSTRKKKIWIRHRAKHLPDTKEEEFFSRTLVNLKVWAELPKKNFHVSEFLFNVCLFVKLISLLMKSKQRAWLTALCHKFSKVKSLSQASKYNTFLPAQVAASDLFTSYQLRNFTRHITT